MVDDLLPSLRLSADDPALSHPESLFPFAPKALRLEVGFGAGEHLAAQAEDLPDVGFIGCEPYLNGVSALLAEISNRGLNNIRILDDDARPLLRALPDACLDRFTLLFSDPWPKTRHHGRRVVQTDTLAEIARLLKPGAFFHFASDHAGYLDWTLFHVLNNPAFSWTARRAADWRERPEGSVQTRYERKRKSGGAPAHLLFRRQA
ncbi:MAG: tRNA (guanosine(46)-N7)-methyltransferase TrmB [Rhodospirillales bacterium]